MKVAVIGGGFSGMLAAYLLEKEGIEVTVYEKEAFIGGHCQTLVSKDVYMELGTICSFTRQIKELLIALQVDYTERFVYRNFVDAHYHSDQHMPREDIVLLMEELAHLNIILENYAPYLSETNFGYIPPDLMLPLKFFLQKFGLKLVSQVIAPHLSAFGFGNIDELQAYYVFKAFDMNTLYAFIQGEKLLVINKGTSELIYKLSQKISDIRYGLPVTNVEVVANQVKVETAYGIDFFDKVLITTKLPTNVIKDPLYNELMKKIDTNPFITCVYEVSDSHLAATYYKAHLGQKGKVQFFYTSRQNNRTIVTTYTYGRINPDLIAGITADLQKTGITIKQLITVKQWYIFPHLNAQHLTQSFYQEIHNRQKTSPICLIGSLVCKPSIDHLYLSIKHTIQSIVTHKEAHSNPK